jgi:hypothetical protein
VLTLAWAATHYLLRPGEKAAAWATAD